MAQSYQLDAASAKAAEKIPGATHILSQVNRLVSIKASPGATDTCLLVQPHHGGVTDSFLAGALSQAAIMMGRTVVRSNNPGEYEFAPDSLPDPQPEEPEIVGEEPEQPAGSDDEEGEADTGSSAY